MAFLKLTNEAEATGALKRLYDAARSRAGYVANIIKLMSRDAPTAEASIQFNRIAEGLGVDPEDWMKPAPSEWRERKAKWPRS